MVLFVRKRDSNKAKGKAVKKPYINGTKASIRKQDEAAKQVFKEDTTLEIRNIYVDL